MTIDEESGGITPSERYLHKLCQRTFLRLWSYPNLFRNQKVGAKGDGKELCDLLVVCGDDVIIFSDKSCEYPDTGDERVDWCRWYRRAIEKSAKQIYGAERWLKLFPSEMYLDRSCATLLPITLNITPQIRFHRIAVALNSGERSRRSWGGSGALAICPEIVGADHYTPTSKNFRPYSVGQIDPAKGYIHILDDVTLDILLGELDTVTDFCSYLTRKEALIQSGHLAFASGDEQLLAYYLKTYDRNGKHDFNLPQDGVLALVEGMWEGLQQQPAFIAKKQADRGSYLWDAIIEDITGHRLADTTSSSKAHSVADFENAIRYMAKESRVSRRLLAWAMIECRSMVQPGQYKMRSMSSPDSPGTAFVFVFASWNGQDLEGYKRYRQNYLNGYCVTFAYVHRDWCQRVIGIATEASDEFGMSHDLFFFEPAEWTPEMETDARHYQELKGWLKPENVTKRHIDVYEYPRVIEDQPRPVAPIRRFKAKIGRNQICPCGSGKKFKKCCMQFVRPGY